MPLHQRFRRWSAAGVWQAVATTFAPAMADNVRHGVRHALRTLAEGRPADLIADKGYDSDAIGEALIQDDLRPVIPSRSNGMSAVR